MESKESEQNKRTKQTTTNKKMDFFCGFIAFRERTLFADSTLFVPFSLLFLCDNSNAETDIFCVFKHLTK